ncbi:hypothetical protein DXG03_008811, partial [Asterophora parasitica]
SKMQSDDQLLYEKVINDAGIRNDLVLSLPEKKQAKALLGDAERTLLVIEEEIAALQARRQVHVEHVVNKFHVAMAPIKNLPVELLSIIFSYFTFAWIPNDKFYHHSHAPFILGKVCALWRHVSRSDPTLWRVNVSATRLPCELLPDVAKAYFKVDLRDYNVNPCTIHDTFIPILRHITHLELFTDAIQLDMFWRNCSPESFIRLESLDLVIWKSTESVQTVDSSLLYDASRWAEYTPFRLAHNLQSLTIEGYDKDLQLVPFILAFDTFRHLRSLLIASVESADGESPASLALRAMQPWASSLSVLNIASAPIADGLFLRELLIQCKQLTRLCSTAPSLPGIFDRDISLPHLESLYLKSIEHPWLFQSLFTPALSRLKTEFKFKHYFDMTDMCRMITSSGCSITSFICKWSGTVNDRRDCPYFPDPCGVFRVIPAARDVRIQYMWLDLDTAANLASGKILPCVEQAEWAMNNELSYGRMIQKRAKWEQKTYGRLVLKRYWSHVMSKKSWSETHRWSVDTLIILGEDYGISVISISR